MKTDLIKFLEESLNLKLDFDKLLEKPKVQSNGDLSMPCFIIAKDLGKNPAQIAKEFKEKLSKKLPDFLEKVQATGPFLNFYFNSEKEAKEVLENISDGSMFNFKNLKMGSEKVILEYPSPNTNKALHLGHVRNMLIGNSLTKILTKVGNKVIKTTMNNDRGIAICKSMLGYKLFFEKDTPESLDLKSDEFVSKCYVKFEAEAKNDEDLSKQAQDMLVKWEAGDKETLNLWKKVMNWVFEGYKISFENFKVGNFDSEYFESQIYDKGKEMILDGLKKQIQGFGKEEDGAVFCDLSDVGYDKKYLLRGDGTTLYMTQDLYLARLKEKDFAPDKSIFIVGKEQEYHFKVLFEILSRLGFGGIEKNYHFAYGYVYDKDGKKFSSRKGKVIGADWLLEEIVSKAKENLLTKEISKDLSEDELIRRSKIIGYAALSFSMLRVNPIDDMKFDLDRALAFEGETGPYIQYTYARIQSILKKFEGKFDNLDELNYSLLEEKEKNLIKILKEYTDIVKESADKYKISAVANYLIKLCKAFNDFYQNCPILKAEKSLQKLRIVLAHSCSLVIKDGLELLDIEVLNEM